MRGNLETIVGAMFAGKTSELLKRILWAKHQNKKIIVIKPSIDNRYSNEKIITHNNLSHECYSMSGWEKTLKRFIFEKSQVDMVFLDEIQFMDTNQTLHNVETLLNKGIDVVCAGLDQDSRGKPWETSSMLLGLSDKIVKIYGFCNVCGFEATKTYRKTEGGERTKVGVDSSDDLVLDLKKTIREKIGPIATPDFMHITAGLPKTRSGKIMRRILRKIASNDFENLGDTSTLADPSVVNNLIANRQNK